MTRAFFKQVRLEIPSCIEIPAELDDVVLKITDFVANLTYFRDDLKAFCRVIREVGVDEDKFRFICWYFNNCDNAVIICSKCLPFPVFGKEDRSMWFSRFNSCRDSMIFVVEIGNAFWFLETEAGIIRVVPN